MEFKTIEDLIDVGGKNIDSKELYEFLNNKLQDLYQKDKVEPLFDYSEIRYSAMIDLIYELMPSLRNEIEFEKPIIK